MSKDKSAKIPTPQAVRGTQDMLGDFADRFAHVVDTFERVRRLYGYKRIEVPVIEPTAVFARSLGETTDVVSKEMYSFEDRGGESITLRPEFTAGIARAYVTNGWQQFAPLKVATHGPLFRYERPQKGRYRQFHQLDAEVIGSDSPLADAELLVFADQLLKELGISEGVTLTLNTLGDAASRDAWRAALVEHFEAHRGNLSEDSLARLDKNPLRILDSKDPKDGAQGTVLGGGRYDGLIENLGGPPTAAVGWAAGIERLAMLLADDVIDTRLDFVIAVEDDGRLMFAMNALAALRNKGFATEIVATGSPRKRFDKAGKIPARALISIGTRDSEPYVNIRGDDKLTISGSANISAL